MSAAWRIAVGVPLLLAIIVAVSAWASVVVHGMVDGAEQDLAGFISDKGAHKVMRRLMMLLAIPLVVWVFRTARWGGLRDIGWSRDPDRRTDPAWSRDIAIGWAIGVPTLAATALAAVWGGTRVWAPDTPWWGLAVGLVFSMLSATLIAVLEETLMRGVLFRVLARLWSAVPAALASSLLFSGLHFFKASPDAYGDGGILAQTAAVVWSALSAPMRVDAFEWRFVNLALMGMVLCLFVARTHTVWVAVGVHAAWIWMWRLHESLTSRVLDHGAGAWIGGRADGTDAGLTTLVLVLLAAAAWRWMPGRESAPDGGRGP
jgi:membrane protease YdiL (CAAX protease family)